MLHNVNFKKVWKTYRLKTPRMENSKVKIVKATLCAVSLFNRRRDGELQRMKVADFET
jgi:hypothetical protein